MGLWIRVAVLLVVFVGSAIADEHNSEYGIIHLSATAEKEVKNDLLIATLIVHAEDNDPAQLANRINATMGWALTRLKPMTAIKHKTLNYQTNPVYDRKREKVLGWRAQQTLQLESQDFEAAGKAIELLQSRLKMTSMQLQPQPSTRKAAEDELINEALNAFKARAELVQTNFGASNYALREIHVNTGSHFVPPRYDARISHMQASEAAPAIEGGTSQVSVQVQGSIELD
ncbi:MAG: SIMPL domain-containing protein [Gammaproteobacteria bacterium]|nr:SIMPL domain-containing protein [Gammaproteobacteria bacterium]